MKIVVMFIFISFYMLTYTRSNSHCEQACQLYRLSVTFAFAVMKTKSFAIVSIERLSRG